MKARGIIGLFGVWLIVAAIWRFVPVEEIWSDLVAGIVTAILGFSFTAAYPGNGWVCGIAGLWVIASAFIAGLHAGRGTLINNIITGLVLIVAGFTLPQTPGGGNRSARAA